ncbi:MAG: sugar kinase [Chloroflexota bacterium]
MAKFDVTTIGEGQLRYCVPAGVRLETATHFDVYVTGTESNIVSLLARLGWQTGWVSALPNSPLGRRVSQELKAAGVDLGAVRWEDDARIATYYVEYAVPPRSTQVYYDRANTPYTRMTVEDIDWGYLLDTRLLHISGLTLPISPEISQLLLTAIDRAKTAGVKVSFDMNYRTRLWTTNEARAIVQPLLRDIDVLFFGRRDAQQIFNAPDDPQAVLEILGTMTDAETIIVSLSNDGLIGWDRTQNAISQVPARRVEMIDRIGAGDAMVAGVLHGWLQDDLSKGLRYGALTAALALSQWGDQVITTRDEIDRLVDLGDATDITR